MESLPEATAFDEHGKQVYPCSVGEKDGVFHIHRGDYALECWMRHNCPHTQQIALPNRDTLACVSCGAEIKLSDKELDHDQTASME